MNMNQYLPTRLITGRGCVASSAGFIKKLGKRCLIVTGRNSARKCGALCDVITVLKANGQSYSVYDRIGQNPLFEDCRAGADPDADFIIGIGGGSPLDAAKCIAVLSANPGMSVKELYSLCWPNVPIPVVAIGTTAGTGSEVTKVSVITTPEGRKKSFHHESIYPVLALGDPAYTMSLSPYFTRSTAADALAHCMESYFNTNANALSRSYAVSGIRLFLKVFDQKVLTDDVTFSPEEREDLYNASIFGGLAINITGTAFPHNVGYLLTETFHVPHGIACAVFLDEFLNRCAAAHPELETVFLREIGCDRARLLELTGLVTPACELRIPETLIASAHCRWENNASIAKSLCLVTAGDVDEMLRRKFPES